MSRITCLALRMSSNAATLSNETPVEPSVQWSFLLYVYIYISFPCRSLGITLVEIPHWWRHDREALVATILHHRHDLHSLLPTIPHSEKLTLDHLGGLQKPIVSSTPIKSDSKTVVEGILDI